MGRLGTIRKSRREGGELGSGCRDSISSLPDEILGKILSLLPTKLAASTSILSKRWMNLLPLVDTLDFDDSMFLYPDRDREEEEERRYFEYSGYVSSFYILSDRPSLVEAKLDLRLWESTIAYDGDVEDGYRSVNGFSVIFGNTTFFLEAINRTVKTLHLSPHSLEAILFCCEYILVFENLLTLSFESDKDKGWHVVPRLLKRAPNLQTLVIKGLIHRVTGRCGDMCPCLLRTKKYNKVKESVSKNYCLPTLAVKVLEISGYGGTRREIQQMRHFLGNLKCLELVKIGVVQQKADNKYLRRNLMSLPKLSSKCNIQFI